MDAYAAGQAQGRALEHDQMSKDYEDAQRLLQQRESQIEQQQVQAVDTWMQQLVAQHGATPYVTEVLKVFTTSV